MNDVQARHGQRNQPKPQASSREILEYGLLVKSNTMTKADVEDYFDTVTSWHINSFRHWWTSQVHDTSPKAFLEIRRSYYGVIIQDRSLVTRLLEHEGETLSFKSYRSSRTCQFHIEKLRVLPNCAKLEEANDKLVEEERRRAVSRFFLPKFSSYFPAKIFYSL